MKWLIWYLYWGSAKEIVYSRVYAERFPDRRHPSVLAFKRLRQRFVNTGSVKYDSTPRRKRTTNEDNEFAVIASVVEYPNCSTRDISHRTDIIQYSVWKILKKYSYRPYQIQLHQELLDHDFQRRLMFCE